MHFHEKGSQGEHQYIYAITRRDLSFPQKAVQAGHAIFEASQEFRQTYTQHPNLILCEVRDEQRLSSVIKKLQKNNIKFVAFHEPDRDNELTAVCTEPVTGEARRVFRDYQLIKENKNV